MSISLIHSGRTPASPQFNLDTFVEHYNAADAADVVLLDPSVPQRGDAHGDYPFMFVTDRRVAETGEKSSAIDVVYMGIMKTLNSGTLTVGTLYAIANYVSGDDFTNVGAASNTIGVNFVATGTTPANWSHGSNLIPLPPAQNESEDAVMSASSMTTSFGLHLQAPVTVQFYAPSNIKSFVSYLGQAATGFADDPTGDPQIITVSIGDATFTPGSFSNLSGECFTTFVAHTLKPKEIVAGRYWQNVSKKVKTYIPWVFTITSGAYVSLGATGVGYHVGDTLTVSDGISSAVIYIDSVGVAGSVYTYHQTSNTFTTNQYLLPSTGGHGTGALWNIIIIP